MDFILYGWIALTAFMYCAMILAAWDIWRSGSTRTERLIVVGGVFGCHVVCAYFWLALRG